MFLQRLNPSSFSCALHEMGAHPTGQAIMAKKAQLLSFKITDLPLSATLILKQEALRIGAELATPKNCILAKEEVYDCLLVGTLDQLQHLAQKCAKQDFGLKTLAKELETHLNSPKIAPSLMAIVNVTPDSFYPDSRHSAQSALRQIYRCLEQKIAYIDIGAASSRPGSIYIDANTEIARLKELCIEIKNQQLYRHAKFSIDTYNHKSAAFALEHGFCMLNDVNGFRDVEMFAVAKAYRAQVVLMHSLGVPLQAHQQLTNDHLWEGMEAFFRTKIAALQEQGISDIILDIGFGFSKQMPENLALIKHLAHFLHFGYPLLVGCSRKKSVGEVCAREVQDRLAGTLALHLKALENGASILRVHDIPEHLDILAIHNAFLQIP
ncbi:Alternative dihydrofolate reductase 2 / Dihydropteroate synthase [Helicobacter heilmannii]|uniref:dihydropteroate synthase n=1 Tax=Helicobacter heilmannii TaxID=35817 RepID=A0A0K2XPR6_HELHE|nr:dihydropteroate synthase [Helicobacter heilmannii]BDQ26466.1 bifunctional dihydropteroate synthase/dihydropteroate reductase [Helicobacter heilmannii]CCM11446.1 Alternative dihydrofolate reductase 2 / Dihydropteroate synthase [Helicobacter heilmannii ASB1.4]CRF47594.1 Alternative dihydrofolate reductase 2 / Dihydropteroate synthase [Helicobacter heilmannii]CRI34868.1 Alternative dihydrofolate reductase 2 / Dihydropteroate synthase [Helicobacter heilmannii]